MLSPAHTILDVSTAQVVYSHLCGFLRSPTFEHACLHLIMD